MEKAFFVVNAGARKVDAKKVNIDGSDDVFYRYKCPQLLIQVIGKGKMIKTVLLNNDDFARGLHLMPEYVPAYLGYEIGAQFKYESKKPERERAHISGEYTTLELSDVIKKLIREIVLCKNCKLPELKMSCETKKKLIFLTCAGCGNREELKKCNPKFLKYITNNPPGDVGGVAAQKAPQQPRAQKKKEPDEEKEKEKEKDEENGGPVEDAVDEEEKEAQNGPTLEIDEADIARTELDLKRAAEQGIEWHSDISKEAIASRRAELVPEAIKKLVADSSNLEQLKSFVKSSPSDDELISRISALKVDADEAVDVLFPHVFQKDYLKDAKAHLKLLKSVLATEAGQVAFLLQLESSLLEKGDAFIKKSATYIKSFYDQDLVEEQAILKWHSLDDVKDDRVRRASKALIDWLQTAEEESDDDDE